MEYGAAAAEGERRLFLPLRLLLCAEEEEEEGAEREEEEAAEVPRPPAGSRMQRSIPAKGLYLGFLKEVCYAPF